MISDIVQPNTAPGTRRARGGILASSPIPESRNPGIPIPNHPGSRPREMPNEPPEPGTRPWEPGREPKTNASRYDQ